MKGSMLYDGRFTQLDVIQNADKKNLKIGLWVFGVVSVIGFGLFWWPVFPAAVNNGLNLKNGAFSLLILLIGIIGMGRAKIVYDVHSAFNEGTKEGLVNFWYRSSK